MRRRFRNTWGMAALAMAGAMMGGGGAARAGTAVGIVVTKGHTVQTGDPTYEYVFDIELLAGSTLDNGGYITIYDLPALTADALTLQPNIHWGSSVQLLGITPSGYTVPDSPTLYNVTWEWNGSSPIVAPETGDLDLGTFIIGSTTELSSPPSPVLIYVGSLDGVTETDEGTVAVNAVPEPSSAVLLVTAAGVLPLGLHLARRRRRAPRA